MPEMLFLETNRDILSLSSVCTSNFFPEDPFFNLLWEWNFIKYNPKKATRLEKFELLIATN
jgi:hypothetical protein